MLRQINFFKVSQQLTGIFKVSDTWTNSWNNMVEEKAVVEKQISKKTFAKDYHACSVEGVLWVSDWTARPYFQVAGPTEKTESSSKL